MNITTNILNEIEKEIIKSFLKINNFNEDFYGKAFESLEVMNRRMTGVGFYTDLVTNKAFKEERLKSLRWTKAGALLNHNLKVGFLVYVDEFKINCIEGFTYGDTAWPKKITSFEMRILDNNKF